MATIVCVDLVTETGQIIRIECPAKFEDELYDSLDNERKRGGWWCPAQFDGCTCTLHGMLMSRIDMQKVIGTL